MFSFSKSFSNRKVKNISEIKLEWNSSVYFADDEENCRMPAANSSGRGKTE